MSTEDIKIDRSESGFINKITNFREHGISFNKSSSKYTPKYFTLWDGYNFLPHIFNLISVSKTLPLPLNITTSVFVTLR